MTYYLYKTEGGRPEILDYRLPEQLLGGHVLIRTLDQPVSLLGMVFDQDNNLVPRPETYDQQRRRAYPAVTDQLDAIWHAMNRGEIPRVPEFYDPIAEVKAKYPKASN